MADRPQLSEAELEVIKRLWGLGPSTVRAVHEDARGRGRSWAYTTVQTLLHRLKEKGYVAVEPAASGPAHVFRAVVSREDLLRDGLESLADRLCEGAPAPLVLALVQGGKLPPEEIARLRGLLDELDGPAGRGPSRSRRGQRG